MDTVGTGSTPPGSMPNLPGVGWTEFDPTNGSYIGTNLVRVGVARMPEQVKPITGTFTGGVGGHPSAASSMSATVTVTRES